MLILTISIVFGTTNEIINFTGQSNPVNIQLNNTANQTYYLNFPVYYNIRNISFFKNSSTTNYIMYNPFYYNFIETFDSSPFDRSKWTINTSALAFNFTNGTGFFFNNATTSAIFSTVFANYSIPLVEYTIEFINLTSELNFLSNRRWGMGSNKTDATASSRLFVQDVSGIGCWDGTTSTYFSTPITIQVKQNYSFVINSTHIKMYMNNSLKCLTTRPANFENNIALGFVATVWNSLFVDEIYIYNGTKIPTANYTQEAYMVIANTTNYNLSENKNHSINISIVNDYLRTNCTIVNCQVPFEFYSNQSINLTLTLINTSYINYGDYFNIGIYAYSNLLSDTTTTDNTSKTYYSNPAALYKGDYFYNQSINFTVTDNTNTYNSISMVTNVDWWSTGINISLIGNNLTLWFSDKADIIIYTPTTTYNRTNTNNITYDLNDLDEGLISIRISITGANNYRQYYEFYNQRESEINESFKLLTGLDMEQYIQMMDISGAPRDMGEVTLYLRNMTNNNYELVTKRLTTPDGYTQIFSTYNALNFYKLTGSVDGKSSTPMYTQLNESSTLASPIKLVVRENATYVVVPIFQYPSVFVNRSQDIQVHMYYTNLQNIVYRTIKDGSYTPFSTADRNFKYIYTGELISTTVVSLIQAEYRMKLIAGTHFSTSGTENISLEIFKFTYPNTYELMHNTTITYKSINLSGIAPIDWKSMDNNYKAPLALIAILLIAIFLQFAFKDSIGDSSAIGKNTFLIGLMLLPIISTSFIAPAIVALIYYGALGLKKLLSNTG